jgi:hypothetical protein
MKSQTFESVECFDCDALTLNLFLKKREHSSQASQIKRSANQCIRAKEPPNFIFKVRSKMEGKPKSSIFGRKSVYDKDFGKEEEKPDEVLVAVNFFNSIQNKKSVCAYCNKTYLERFNLGTLECCKRHPGIWTGSEYTCCQKIGINFEGCKMYDHSSVIQYPDCFSLNYAFVVISKEQFSELKYKPKAKYEIFKPESYETFKELVRIYRTS